MTKKKVSTRNLSLLPDIEPLRQRMQQMAVLAEIVGIECSPQAYEFHPKWSKNEQMGAYKNGSGDELFVHFTRAGCYINGFAHESTMTSYRTDPPTLWPGLFENIPPQFASSVKEPAFDTPHTTFVIWRLATDKAWQIGPVKFPDHYYGDGSEDLLGMVVMSAAEFAEWLAENYEAEVDPKIVAAVFDHQPLTKSMLAALNPNAELAELVRAVKEVGFPLASK